MNPLGYQAAIMKASQSGNERQEDLAGGKPVIRKGRKKLIRATKLLKDSQRLKDPSLAFTRLRKSGVANSIRRSLKSHRVVSRQEIT